MTDVLPFFLFCVLLAGIVGLLLPNTRERALNESSRREPDLPARRAKLRSLQEQIAVKRRNGHGQPVEPFGGDRNA